MATRRARIKLAPNLGLSRNKNKIAPVVASKPKIVIKSDTESESNLSDHETVDETSVPNVVENLANQISLKEESENNFLDSYAPIEITPKSDNCPPLEKPCANGTLPEPTSTNDVTSSTTIHTKSNEVSDCPPTNGIPVEPKNKVRAPIGRNKFRPNLNVDRSRHGSGGVVSNGYVSSTSSRSGVTNGSVSPVPATPMTTRSRTISSSSTNSESEHIVNKPQLSSRDNQPANDQQQQSANISDSPILRKAISSPKPARIRRTTESRSTLGDRSQFLRRKLDHKRKFSGGVPERGSLTMFDLIYYNPSHGQRMSVEEEHEETVDDPENDNDKTEDHNEVPQQEINENENSSEAIPVPQVKVVNGEIIVDETSLQVETTQAKEAKVKMKETTIVFEDNKTSTTYGRWSRKRRHNDWGKKETIKFYRALAMFSTDFSLMEHFFKNRTRQELRLKFKKEEKMNNKMIDRCLKEKGMFAELDSLLQDTDEDDYDDPDEDFDRARSRKPKKKRPRKRYKNRGYYASSSDGEEADVEASKSPVRKLPKPTDNEKTPRHPVVQGVTQVSVSAPSVGNISIHHSQPGVQFPPGLLAANPSLAGAKPGSLVVVASPHRPDNALLSVYMVPDKTPETVQPRVMSPRSNNLGPGHPELKLDPAVIRAVDRGKLGRQRTMSESMMKVGRKRTYSEMKEAPDDGSENVVAAKIHRRQRTCSESGIQTRQQLERSDLGDGFMSDNYKSS